MHRLLPLYVVLALCLPVKGETQAGRVDEVTVSPAGPVRTISAALSRIRPGGRVVVRAGVYREPTIEITQPVELVGMEAPVLDGEGTRGILLIAADDVTVRGFTLRHVGTSY